MDFTLSSDAKSALMFTLAASAGMLTVTTPIRENEQFLAQAYFWAQHAAEVKAVTDATTAAEFWQDIKPAIAAHMATHPPHKEMPPHAREKLELVALSFFEKFSVVYFNNQGFQKQ